jgi:hypothetical protein
LQRCLSEAMVIPSGGIHWSGLTSGDEHKCFL